MKTTIPVQLSIVPIRTTTRVTTQTLHILTFIHRFRHVTAKHLQASLGHTSVTTTHNRLSLLYTKGYLVRQYGPDDIAHNQPMSYCLAPEGLVVLRAYYPSVRYESE